MGTDVTLSEGQTEGCVSITVVVALLHKHLHWQGDSHCRWPRGPVPIPVPMCISHWTGAPAAAGRVTAGGDSRNCPWHCGAASRSRARYGQRGAWGVPPGCGRGRAGAFPPGAAVLGR